MFPRKMQLSAFPVQIVDTPTRLHVDALMAVHSTRSIQVEFMSQ